MQETFHENPSGIIDLIQSGCHVHLVTLNQHGSPHVTLVWIGLDGDEVVAAHLPRNKKVRNIECDPRIAISLEAPTQSAMGLTEYAVLYGEARIQEGGAPELLQELAYVYIDPGVKFPPWTIPRQDMSHVFEWTESRGWVSGQDEWLDVQGKASAPARVFVLEENAPCKGVYLSAGDTWPQIEKSYVESGVSCPAAIAYWMNSSVSESRAGCARWFIFNSNRTPPRSAQA